MAASRLINRNITSVAGRTSMRLEPEIWEALREICLRENQDLRDLIRTVEKAGSTGGRTSAVRVHVLQYFRAAATSDGHVQAGHGQSDDAISLDGTLELPIAALHRSPMPAEEGRTLEA